MPMTLADLTRIEQERLKDYEARYGAYGGSSESGPTMTPEQAHEMLKKLNLLPEPMVQQRPVPPAPPKEEGLVGPDANIYAALTGAAPTRRENQEAIADVLRRRGRLGEVAAIAGSPSLRSFGTGLMNQSDARAKELQSIRQKDIDDAQTAKYQQWQIEHGYDTAREAQRQNTIQGLNQAIQATSVHRGSSGLNSVLKPRPLTKDDSDFFEQTTSQLNAVNKLDDILIEYGQDAANYKGIPFTAALTRAFQARGVYAGEEATIAKDAWDQFKRDYEAVRRVATVGTTLTANEKAMFKESSPNENWTPSQIRLALGSIRKLLNVQKEARAGRAIRDGADKLAVAHAAGLVDIKGNEIPEYQPTPVLDAAGNDMSQPPKGRKNAPVAPADDPNRELTPAEMEEFKKLQGQ